MVRGFEEEQTGLVYRAMVPAPQPGTLVISVGPGKAAAVSDTQGNALGALVVEVGDSGNAVAVSGPVVTGVLMSAQSGSGRQDGFGTRSVAARGSSGSGGSVRVTVTFSEPVTVDLLGGTPAIGLRLGERAREAPYAGGTETETLLFVYTVTGEDGSVTGGSVTPDSLTLNGGTIRSWSGAEADLRHPGAALDGTGGDELPALTGQFEAAPEAHDGQSAFSFHVAFSEDIGISYQTLRDESFTVTGGTVTRARRVDGRHDLWEITLEPDSREAVTITLPGGRACGTAGAVCTRGESPRPLGNSPSATVAGPPAEPLEASFSGMPAEHTGEAFTFGLTFSEDLDGDFSYRTLRDAAFELTGGTVRKAQRREQGSNLGWTITVEPDDDEPVTIRLPETTDCDASGAICTDDGRPLSHSLLATVVLAVAISVADARVEEDKDAVLAFVVTLDRAASRTVTVDYATEDGTAAAGEDYTATSGTLTFTAGDTSKTISVAVLDDSHDEGEETLTLRLSNPSGGRLIDGEATGTIENRDPLPRAFMARFGRTVAVQVVEQVEERIKAPRQTGFRGRFAGRQVGRGLVDELAVEFLNRFGANRYGAGLHTPMAGSPAGGAGSMCGSPGGGAGVLQPAGPAGGAPMAADPMGSLPATHGGLDRPGRCGMDFGGRNLLTGSAFQLNRETGRGGILSFWSRGAQSQFYGREGDLALDGRVRTTMLGADYQTGPVVAGLSLAHSRGRGGYSGAGAGEVISSVTGLYPWLGYQVTDRITLWGVTGYGKGALALTPGEGATLKSGLSMAMAAGGMRGELADSVVGGFGLAFKADALWVGTGIESVEGPEGRLAATKAAVTRFRTGLEASRNYSFGRRLSLQPSLEVGLRRDGGDAETGAGVDLGGGLIVSDTVSGLSADVRVRTLLAHQDEGFRERGFSVSLSFDPTPRTPLGFLAKVTPSWGGQARSGAQALWGRNTMAGMANGGVLAGNRLEAELGYGLPVGSRLVGTPRFGIGASGYGRDYRLGYGLRLFEGGGMSFDLSIDANRRVGTGPGGAEHGVQGRLTARWQ